MVGPSGRGRSTRLHVHPADRPGRSGPEQPCDVALRLKRLDQLAPGLAVQADHVGQLARKPPVVDGGIVGPPCAAEQLGRFGHRRRHPGRIAAPLLLPQQQLGLQQVLRFDQQRDQLPAGLIGGRLVAEAMQKPFQRLGRPGLDRRLKPRLDRPVDLRPELRRRPVAKARKPRLDPPVPPHRENLGDRRRLVLVRLHVDQLQVVLQRGGQLAGGLETGRHQPQVPRPLNRIVDQPLHLLGHAPMAGEVRLESLEHRVPQQVPSPRVGSQLQRAAQRHNGLRPLALIQEDFTPQRQRLRVGRVGRQARLGQLPQGTQLIKNLQTVRALRDHSALVADQVPRHVALPRAGEVGNLAGVQIDRRHLGRAQRHEVLTAAGKTLAAGDGPFGQFHLAAFPGCFAVGHVQRPHVAPGHQHHVAVVNAGHVQRLLAGLLPQQPAVDQVQAVQVLRFGGRHQHPTFGQNGRGVGPSPGVRLVRTHHHPHPHCDHLRAIVALRFLRVGITPQKRPGSQVHGHDSAGRGGADQDAVGIRGRDAGETP